MVSQERAFPALRMGHGRSVMVTRRSTTSRRLSPWALRTSVSSHEARRPTRVILLDSHWAKNADTAQWYRNEAEAGKAIRESGLARKDIYITTKFSGRDNLTIEEAMQASLKNVRIPHTGVEHVVDRTVALHDRSWV